MQTIFREISDLYSPIPSSSEDEVSDLVFIKHCVSSLQSASQSHRASLAQSVAKAESDLRDATARVEREAAADLASRLSTLSSQESVLTVRKEKASAAVERLTGAISSLNRERDAKASELAQLDRKRGEDIPRLKHAISLYANITGIKWDYGGQAGVLAGTISLPNREEIQQFTIDPNVTPMFDATNQLWDLMSGRQNCAEVC